jgi:hypothetical protein
MKTGNKKLPVFLCPKVYVCILGIFVFVDEISLRHPQPTQTARDKNALAKKY